MGTRSKLELQSAIKESINELFASEEFINRITKNIADKVEEKVEAIENELKTHTYKIRGMEQKIDNLHQNTKVNNLCIYGVIEEKDENVEETLIKLFKNNTDFDLNKENIMSCYRVGHYDKSKKKIRPIILKVDKHDTKIKILRSSRQFKGKKIFIAEDLTKMKRNLLIQAKNSLGEKNVWSFNGQIYTKIGEKNIRLQTEEDLLKYTKST